MSSSGVQYYFEVTVLDGQEEPVEGASVTVEDDQGEVEVVWGDSNNTTNADGVVGGLVYNGEYTATAESDGETGSSNFTIDGEDVQFDIVLGEDDTDDGSEETQQGFGGADGTTDENGIFGFAAPNGEYTISVEDPAGELDVTTGEVTVVGSGLDIQVELGGEVTVSTSETEDDTEVSLTVETLEAEGVTASEATLRGKLTEFQGTDEVFVSFEWVENTGSFPETTDGQAISSTGTFSEDLTDLESDTQYDFRAIAEARDEVVTGGVLSLTTAVGGS